MTGAKGTYDFNFYGFKHEQTQSREITMKCTQRWAIKKTFLTRYDNGPGFKSLTR